MKRKQKTIIYNPANKDGNRWIENVSLGLRVVGYADELVRLNHTGWFIDSWQDEKYRGQVFRLPARNGAEQFLAGYADPYNLDCALIDFSQIHDSARDAAYSADSLAERDAEDAREYHAKDQAEQRIEAIGDELADNRKSLLAALRERQIACKVAAAGCAMAFPALLAVVKQGILDLLEQREELRRERERLQDNFWLAVE